MSTAYQYNLRGEYVGETVAYGGLLPANTTAVEPIPQVGHWPVWNDNAWENVVDNRQTPYWLDDDTYQTPARHMTTLGPLPDGALLVQPEKPAPTTDELSAKLRTERDARITSCDWIISRHAEEVAMGLDTTLAEFKYSEWLSYRQELRDLTDADGFPWDGGGEQTPWPVAPEM